MPNVDNNYKKINNQGRRMYVISSKLTEQEKQDFNNLIQILEFETPSETIRYCIKLAIANEEAL